MTTGSAPSHADDVATASDAGSGLPVTVSLWQVTKTARRHLERAVLHPAGMTLPEFLVLTLVHDRPGAQTSQVGAHAGMAKATLNGIVTKLETSGLLVRRKAHDQRIIELRPTPEGQATVRRLRQQTAAAEQRLVAGSTILSDLRQIVEMLASEPPASAVDPTPRGPRPSAHGLPAHGHGNTTESSI